MKNIRLILFSLLIYGMSQSALASVKAWLDQDQVSAGSPVQLTLQHDGQTDTQPDLSPLNKDFELYGRSSGSSIQIINGKMSAQILLRLTLMPKHSGKITLPPLQWDGQSTPALTLTVGGNSSAANSGNNTTATKNANVFLTTSMDQKQPYVQAAVTLTVKLYVSQPLYQASLELAPNQDVLVQQLGKDQQHTEMRNGQGYQVIERKYLLIPQHSGSIRLDGPILNAQIQDTRNLNNFGSDPFFNQVFGHNPFANMMGATQPLRLQGDPLVLNVRPRPASDSGPIWLPARNVTLQQSWQPDTGDLHVGDPITRQLHLSATGLTAAQLPDLSQLMTLPDGLKAYPDQAKLDTTPQGDSVIGTRTQDIAIIATQPGHYVIPALHLTWWDTTRNMPRTLDVAERTLNVLPALANSASAVTPAAQPAASSQPPASPVAQQPTAVTSYVTGKYLWAWISLALALLWIMTMLIWWGSKRRKLKLPTATTQPPDSTVLPNATAARKAFQQACRDNNPQAAKRHLLEWATAIWPQHPPAGILALAERLKDPNLKPLLAQLDRACYGGEKWEGSALLHALDTMKDKTTSAVSTSELADLYP